MHHMKAHTYHGEMCSQSHSAAILEVSSTLIALHLQGKSTDAILTGFQQSFPNNCDKHGSGACNHVCLSSHHITDLLVWMYCALHFN